MMFMLNILLMLLMILISIAFLTLLERKILSYIQMRKGPNKVGFMGLLQPFSDALKLLTKEMFYLDYNMSIFVMSPMFMFIFSLMLWLLYPWYGLFTLNYDIMIMMLILSLTIYPVISIGWNSSNNYSMLGSLRSMSQMISFEIVMFLMIFVIMMYIEGYCFSELISFQEWVPFFFLFPYLYTLMFLSMLIELNRTPFDLIEGESELVSGFNVEYYSGMFTLIFLAEYSGILFMSMILTMLFFSYVMWSFNFIFTYLYHVVSFIWTRGFLPRIRYDELMVFCWNDLLVYVLMYTLINYLIKEIICINLS